MIPISSSTLGTILVVMFSIVPATGVFLFAWVAPRVFLPLFRVLALLFLGGVLVLRFLRWGFPDYLHAPYFEHGTLVGHLDYTVYLCVAGLPGIWLREARTARRKGLATTFFTRARESWRQRFGWVQSFLIAVTAATIWTLQPIYPSDAVLRAHFVKHRAAFHQLVVMVGEDLGPPSDSRQYTLGSIDLVSLTPRISPHRAAIYRQLLRSLGADTTEVILDDSLLILNYTAAKWPDEGIKGYVYNYGHTPPSPLVASLDTRGPDFKTRYRPLAPPWYLHDYNHGITLP